MSTGSGTANIYVPKLNWFATAHSFLRRNFDGVRGSETNLVSILLNNIIFNIMKQKYNYVCTKSNIFSQSFDFANSQHLPQ